MLRVEKLRHCCSNSCASDIGRVDMILKNTSSTSTYTDMLFDPSIDTLSLQMINTGNQSLTSFILTCVAAKMFPETMALASRQVQRITTDGSPGKKALHRSSRNALLKSAAREACSLHAFTALSATLSSIILSTSHRTCLYN